MSASALLCHWWTRFGLECIRFRYSFNHWLTTICMFTVLFHPDTGHGEKKPQGLCGYLHILLWCLLMSLFKLIQPGSIPHPQESQHFTKLQCRWHVSCDGWVCLSVCALTTAYKESFPQGCLAFRLMCLECFYILTQACWNCGGVRVWTLLSLLVKWTVSGLWSPNSFFLWVSSKRKQLDGVVLTRGLCVFLQGQIVACCFFSLSLFQEDMDFFLMTWGVGWLLPTHCFGGLSSDAKWCVIIQ